MDGISKAARVGQMIIGVVYLVAGAIKTWEPVLFYWEAIPYAGLLGIAEWETASAVAKAAIVLGPIEFVLGWALLLNWQPRLCLPVATVLMAVFTALTVKAWHMGASIDCGCFGALVERGPGEAAIEDGVMVVVLLFAWWGMRRSANAAPVAARPNWWGAGRRACLAAGESDGVRRVHRRTGGGRHAVFSRVRAHLAVGPQKRRAALRFGT